MPKLWALGSTPAHKIACLRLKTAGFALVDRPENDIQGVFLDVPSFRTPLITPDQLLPQLPEGAVLIGGNLGNWESHPTLDLLTDAEYTAKNADITARCALRLGAGRLGCVFSGMPVLILGWGRIGKCLARLLRALDAEVWVYARKEADRAMLRALGYRALPIPPEEANLNRFRLIYNTAPAPMLSSEKTAALGSCVLMDLASSPGMDGPRIISARGLPGLLAPESSGALIADTLTRLWKERHT